MSVVKAHFGDSLSAVANGLNPINMSKLMLRDYAWNPLSADMLVAAFRSDWIARKCVTIPAYDSLREWRVWQAESTQVEALEELEKEFDLRRKLIRAMVKARLFGGSAIFLGIKGHAPESELVPETVQKDQLEFIHVLGKYEVIIVDVDRDPMSPYFGEPTYYEIKSSNVSAKTYKIHPSRMVRLIGVELPVDAGVATYSRESVWGDSVLDSLDASIKHASGSASSLATVIAEMKLDVINIPGLADKISTPEHRSRFIARLNNANDIKSINSTLVLDEAETWQRISAQFGGATDLLREYMLLACGAADIPATRFLGQAPHGLNATGESDIRNYYDRLSGEQSVLLDPALHRLNEVIIRSALGARPPEIHYIWAPLWQERPGEKADTQLKKAQAHKIDVDAGLIPTTALGTGRVNQLVEDSVYPGLEEAIAEAEAQGDVVGGAMTPPATRDPITGEVLPHPGSPSDPTLKLKLAANQNNPAQRKAQADRLRERAKLLADMAADLDGEARPGPPQPEPPPPAPPSPPLDAGALMDAVRRVVQDEVRAAVDAVRPAPPQPRRRVEILIPEHGADGRIVKIRKETED